MRDSDRTPRSAELTPTAPPQREGSLCVRVRYNECDPMGVAHHSTCVGWFEQGRTELLRPTGVSYRDMERAGLFLVVTRLEIRYKAPARYDDEVLVVTRVERATRARLDHAYELWLHEGEGRRGVLLATAESTLACVDRFGKPMALPDWLVPTREG